MTSRRLSESKEASAVAINLSDSDSEENAPLQRRKKRKQEPKPEPKLEPKMDQLEPRLEPRLAPKPELQQATQLSSEPLAHKGLPVADAAGMVMDTLV